MRCHRHKDKHTHTHLKDRLTHKHKHTGAHTHTTDTHTQIHTHTEYFVNLFGWESYLVNEHRLSNLGNIPPCVVGVSWARRGRHKPLFPDVRQELFVLHVCPSVVETFPVIHCVINPSCCCQLISSSEK